MFEAENIIEHKVRGSQITLIANINKRSGLAIRCGKKKLPLAVDRNHFKRIQRVFYRNFIKEKPRAGQCLVILNQGYLRSERKTVYEQGKKLWSKLLKLCKTHS